MTIFPWQHRGKVFNWGKTAACPTRWKVGRAVRFAPVRGGNGNDCSFITRDFNWVWGKENGTIPF
jgi:hypothetical protein